MTLTSRERVNRMFERRDHDRVPRYDHYWGETIARWQTEGLQGDRETVLQLLGADLQQLGWAWPQPFPGRHEVLYENAETRVVLDPFGKRVRMWKQRSGTPEHLGFDCDSREKWEKIYKPALLASGLQWDVEQIRRNYAQARAQGAWCYLAGVEGFEQTRALMGDEITLIAMAEDPEWIRDVSRTVCDVFIRHLEAVIAAGMQPDGLWVYGDMAFRTSTVCSPQMYRELLWPDHKRLADWAHAHGMKCIYHTDGHVHEVLDDYVAAGFDCLQPLECKAGMDIRELVPIYGDRLAFFGNIDAMVLGTNDRERIEAEVVAKLAAGKSRRCYMYHSDHSIPPSVSWETYRFLIELLDRHGDYN